MNEIPMNELPPGEYALKHANGMSWADVLALHREHVAADLAGQHFSLNLPQFAQGIAMVSEPTSPVCCGEERR